MPHLSTVGWGGMDMTDKGNAPGPKKPYANAKYAKWLTEDGLILLRGWARNGLTDEQIAHNCGITSVTLREWKKKLPSISSALKEGKEVVDILVENALLKRALGYEYIETTHERVKVGVDDDGQPIYEMALTKTVTKMVMPDTTAQIFWLKNRRPERWHDVHRTEHTGKDGGPIEVSDAGKSDAELIREAEEICRKAAPEQG